MKDDLYTGVEVIGKGYSWSERKVSQSDKEGIRGEERRGRVKENFSVSGFGL